MELLSANEKKKNLRPGQISRNKGFSIECNNYYLLLLTRTNYEQRYRIPIKGVLKAQPLKSQHNVQYIHVCMCIWNTLNLNVNQFQIF